MLRETPTAVTTIIVCACAFSANCASTPRPDVHDALLLRDVRATYTTVSDSMPSNGEVEALVAQYRDRLEGETAQVIGVALGQFDKGKPEGSLGNLVADAMLHIVQSQVDDTVHIAVVNNGGLRAPIRDGPITIREVFETAPYENFLAVIGLTGDELQLLANDIARTGGEPIAGFSFHIDGSTGMAGGLRVGNEPVRSDRVYRVVTLDYLLDGGDRIRTLWEPRPRVMTSVALRDAIIQFIQFHQRVTPQLEDRIIMVAR